MKDFSPSPESLRPGTTPLALSVHATRKRGETHSLSHRYRRTVMNFLTLRRLFTAATADNESESILCARKFGQQRDTQRRNTYLRRMKDLFRCRCVECE